LEYRYSVGKQSPAEERKYVRGCTVGKQSPADEREYVQGYTVGKQ
jgi:hypothetical protein